ncbi:hypothetical protein [Pseudomonas sp. DP16D-R1]|jgi:ABC-type Fe3+ transport system permease subunit|uniref:hypothetical protein n=1 Tax=Pseudomonas sp. DP16D-R1 TaxID=2075551 RepID=UPI000CD0B2B9|nr:hypothetical protein [Pseudomonas sp. DP16D-R1]POA78609.1 hypothetical protein C1890_09745 [Pseudomonas sp. DP16D-R1]
MENTPAKWVVSMNGVSVGELDGQQVENLEQEVKRDKRLYLKQGFNYAASMLRGVATVVQIAPFIMVVGATLFALDSPGRFNELLSENAAGLMVVSAYTSLLVGGMAVGLGTACGLLKLGIVNHFTNRKHLLIRRALGLAADGDIQLSLAQKAG